MEDIVRELYKTCETETRTVVVYKVEHVDKDLLNKLNIPSLNLEAYECPKYDKLKHTVVGPVSSCGFHLDDRLM